MVKKGEPKFMNAIVTGGAGFIGSHLTERLIEEGHKVLVLDNLSSGSKRNLSHIKSSRLKFVKADLSLAGTDTDSGQARMTGHWQQYFQDVDWVFHLSALADIVPSIVKPVNYHRANVDSTVNVLQASRRGKVKRFIYAASSSCYGIADKLPTPETAPIAPMYPYALTKYIAEQYVLYWGKFYKLPVISLRLFNVFGPRTRTSGAYGAVFGVFLSQKLHGLPFTVVGDGTQTRDFVFVSDVVEACVLAAKSSISSKVFNVGSGKPQSINRLVELLGGKVVYIPKRPGEPDCTWADIAKIKKVLGWSPEVSLEEGVKIMLKNINYWQDAPVWTASSIDKATKEWFEYLK